MPYWLSAGDEICEACEHGYVRECGFHCSACDAPLCAECVLVDVRTGEVFCVGCRESERQSD